ncbi:MAG: ATP-binding cassette domain-containing protein [Gemmatimonadaceae bacterium]
MTATKGRFRLTEISFALEAGAYGVVIGPAGSGKTTLLEALAGLIRVTGGQVRIDGVDQRRMSPESRDIGLVYQQAYLFPHLSVAQNVGYGASDAATQQEVIERLGVASLLGRDVAGLSGGERQLVALARALARRPRLLLLDEPFSALDPRRRALVRREVRDLHRAWGLTTLQVTHDFAEAGLLGDQAILLDAGRVLQSGPPAEVFRRPASPYVAEFLGAENVFAGTARPWTASGDETLVRGMVNGVASHRNADADAVVAAEVAAEIHAEGVADPQQAMAFETGALTFYAVGNFAPGVGHAVIRAEEVTVARDQTYDSARNRFSGRVIDVATLGALTRVTVDVRGMPIVAAVSTQSARDLALAPGLAVVVSFKAMAVHLC